MPKLMSNYLLNFAKTGHPTPDTEPVWQPHTPSGRETMVLDLHPKIEGGRPVATVWQPPDTNG
jgi:carboxylesterase type B